MPAKSAIQHALALILPVFFVGEHLRAQDWAYHGYDAGSAKYAPYGQINRDNIAKLRLAWRWVSTDFDLVRAHGADAGRNNQSTPLVVGGVLYTPTPLNQVFALDAETGRPLWHFDPQTWKNEPWYTPLARGVAYWRDGEDERILFGTADAYLYALDAKTGRPVASFGDGGRVDLAEAGFDRAFPREWISTLSPPIVCRDVVVVGSSIPDRANTYGKDPDKLPPPGDVRGFDVRTGALVWTFHTIPRPGEFGHETWERDGWRTAGAANVWTMMSADDELGYVYLPVSTPSNDYYGGERPGDGLFGESLVCIKAATGELVWHYQIVHHGLWDLDPPAAPILADITVDGRAIKAVALVTKQAFCFVFDRVTGEPVWPIEERPVPQSDVPGEQSSPTQPFPTKPAPFDRQGLTDEHVVDFTPEIRQKTLEHLAQYDRGPLYTPPTEKGVLMMPSNQGGADWAGAALDPRSGVLYVPSQTHPILISLRKSSGGEAPFAYTGSFRLGQRGPDGVPLTKPPYGRITAIDLNTGEHRWMSPVGRGPVDHPALKGLDLPDLGWDRRTFVVVTPDLLLAASQPMGSLDSSREYSYYVDDEPYLRAFDLRTGALLAEIELPGNAQGSPITYMVEGRQYIAVPGGGDKRPSDLTVLRLPTAEEQSLAGASPRYQRSDADHPRFYQAVQAMDRGDSAGLKALLDAEPALARARGFLADGDELAGAGLLHLTAGYPQRARLPDDVVAMTELLLAAGADPNSETRTEWSTLGLLMKSHQAGELFGTFDAQLALLADGGLAFDAGNGKLLWQVLSGRPVNTELAATLQGYGASIDLRFAAGLGQVEAMRGFFGPDGQPTADAGRLYRPAGGDSAQTASALGAQELLDEALAYAAYNGQVEAAAWLLDRGARVNALVPHFWDGRWGRPDTGCAALHRAIAGQHRDVVALLIEHGADPTLDDVQWGANAVQWASSWNDEEIQQLVAAHDEAWKAQRGDGGDQAAVE